MTTLIAWTGVDSHGTASVYLASESRISWPGSTTWDRGRKLFSAQTQPDISGYQGDVLFPSLLLGQVIDLIDAGVLIESADDHLERWRRIRSVLTDAFVGYPDAQRRPFAIVYATREGERMPSAFHIVQTAWSPTDGWRTTWLPLPSRSSLVVNLGSGAADMATWYERWSRTSRRDTSRSVFSAFCDALCSGTDSLSGGAPQLAGLYRIGCGRTFGVVHRGQRFVHGLPIPAMSGLAGVEWRNALFERCDPTTLSRFEQAAPQPAPRGLGRSTARDLR
jgi:hypothetical protein